MLLWKKSDEDLVVQVLTGASVCQKCCQRFLGERNSEPYKTLHQEEVAALSQEKPAVGEEMEKMENEPARKKSRHVPCPACLGVLQDCFMMPRVRDVVERIRSSGYDAERFTLSLSLPISLSMRQHALWLHLERSVPEGCLGHRQPEDVVPIKQVWKYIYPPVIGSQVGIQHESGDTADFFVELVVGWEKDEEEMSKMVDICPKEYRDRAIKVNVYNMGVYSRQGVEKSLQGGVTWQEFSAHSPVPPTVPDTPFSLNFRLSRNSIFLGGRYCKYSRNLPQTPWILKGKRIVENSTEELIGDRLKEFIQAEQVKFLASGREDVDVRMLGRGRPFAFECVNAKKSRLSEAELVALEHYINSTTTDVRVNSLALVDKTDIKLLKEGEDRKRKRYTALVVTPAPYQLDRVRQQLETLTDLAIQQETPVRVLHRRSNAVRDKTIHSMKVEPVSDVLFKLSVISSAGSYIKELVHGDFVRTVPSVKSILDIDTDILALDVEEVYLDWPPKADPVVPAS